jgi:hypothetical protein
MMLFINKTKDQTEQIISRIIINDFAPSDFLNWKYKKIIKTSERIVAIHIDLFLALAIHGVRINKTRPKHGKTKTKESMLTPN